MTITNNLLVGALTRNEGSMTESGLWDPTFLIHMYTGYLPSRDQNDVSGNIG